MSNFKWKELERSYEPYSYEEGLKDTGKRSSHTQMINCNGDLVYIEYTHRVLIANGKEVTSTGSSSKVVREDLLSEEDYFKRNGVRRNR